LEDQEAPGRNRKRELRLLLLMGQAQALVIAVAAVAAWFLGWDCLCVSVGCVGWGERIDRVGGRLEKVKGAQQIRRQGAAPHPMPITRLPVHALCALVACFLIVCRVCACHASSEGL